MTAGIAGNVAAARQALTRSLDDGRAAERFAKMVAELGGPADLLENPDRYFHDAPVVAQVPAPRAGFIAAIDTRRVGLAVVELGGGRMRATDSVDFDVGLSGFVSLGTFVNAGEPLAIVHARTEDGASRALQTLLQAIIISDAAPPVVRLVHELNDA